MSSSATEGAPFSYAVSGEANELLIYFNRYFELNIGGTNRLFIYFNTIEYTLHGRYFDSYQKIAPACTSVE